MNHQVGPILSARVIHFRVFLLVSGLSLFMVMMLIYMTLAVSGNEKRIETLKSETDAYTASSDDLKRQSEFDDRQRSIVAQISEFMTDDMSLYTPVMYMAELERSRPDAVRFDELVFEREKNRFAAVVVAGEYKDVVTYLKNVEASELFSLAEIKKRGKADRDGVRYHLEFVVSRFGS